MMKTRSSFHSNMTASNGRFCVGIRILYPTVLEFFTTNQVASTKDFFDQSSQNTPLLIAYALKELKDSSWCQTISRSRGNRSSSSADGRKESCQLMGSEWQCLNERQDAPTCLTQTPMTIDSCADGVTCETVDIAEKWPWWDPMQMWRENGGAGNGSNQSDLIIACQIHHSQPPPLLTNITANIMRGVGNAGGAAGARRLYSKQ